MKIIKPYGRSQVDNKIRKIQQTPDSLLLNIPEFSQEHDQLVIGQWISIIDKIATKPNSSRASATKEQHDLRSSIGEACWQLIVQNKHISLPVEEKLIPIWQAKITPYRTDKFEQKYRNAKGRWYKRLVGDIKPHDINPAVIAKKIEQHLYENEFRLNEGSADKRKGLIEARALSIERNVLKPAQEEGRQWSDKDWDVYFKQYDIAQKIFQKCQNLESSNAKKNHRVLLNTAASCLYDHYASLFIAEDGTILKIGQVKDQYAGLFALHMEVKDCYRRQLKDSKRHTPLKNMPKDKGALKALLTHKSENRNTNDLIRLGRIIHYEYLHNGNWPDKTQIANSSYWTSAGQSKIKRNEAFIRVWRHVLALAARTLKDWADPEGTIISDDILGGNSISRVTGKKTFTQERFNRKLPLLFGEYADVLSALPNERKKGFLRHGLQTTAKLRNNSFHFKDLKIFSETLENIETNNDADSLWQTDCAKREARLLATLEAVKAQDYYSPEQIKELYDLLKGEIGSLPLPRFKRLLTRAENAKTKIALPSARTREEMKAHPSLLCQFISLKMVYEGPFRLWLEGDERDVRSYMVRAIERTTQAAKSINSKDPHKDLIEAKAARLLEGMADQPDIKSFFFSLSAATAKEMQVQKGYDPDPDNARQQSKFIEDLKCDVLALAFEDYVKEKRLDYIVNLTGQTVPLDTPSAFPVVQAAASAAPVTWEGSLYLVLHFVPVDEVSKLLHQLRKWEILAEKGKDQAADAGLVRKLQQPLVLYLSMHDAGFQGPTELEKDPSFIGFQSLFERQEDFKTLYATISGDQQVLPVRGLREIMRFGHLPLLRKICGTVAVTGKHVEEKTQLETSLPEMQDQREKAHALYVKAGRNLKEEDLRNYARALRPVVRHRVLTAHVHLTNHVRLHRLLMAVLGRLLDYSGLWERDLYFKMLASLYDKGKKVEDALDEGGLDLLRKGQIVAALRQQTSATLLEKPEKDLTDIRNDFAHFNMLQAEHLDDLDLNEQINRARRLMAYDRKLKNAVSKSIKELLYREGVELSWQMKDHDLVDPVITPKQAQHLQKARVSEKICENLHGREYLEMIANLFSDSRVEGVKDITDWCDQDIDHLCFSKKGKNFSRNGQKRTKNKYSNRKNQHRNKRL
ncbi:MAG: hypothetical protein HWE30_17720 [Methylocystaceae bacterium]|nr:hypothetical protein [Methylocystaceae bacterium]